MPALFSIFPYPLETLENESLKKALVPSQSLGLTTLEIVSPVDFFDVTFFFPGSISRTVGGT